MRIVYTHNLQLSASEEEAEFDRPETVSMITMALRQAGHEVEPLEVSGPASRLVARLEALNPDLVFNTAEGTRGRFREGFYPALFDQLGFAYTGSDAYVCTATLDKHFTKLVLAHHGVSTPGWRFVDDVRQLEGHEMRFPLMVKPNFEGSSMGITVDSVVDDERQLRRRVNDLLSRYPAGVLVEEFIVGRDLVVPFIEGVSPDTGGVLEPAVYNYRADFTSQRKYQIYDYEMKSSGFDAVSVKVPADIPRATRAAAIEQSRRVLRILGVRDMGRIDYRVTEDGEIYFLELNALPSLEQGASIYLSGALAGLKSVSKVLQAMVRSAAERQGLSLPALKRRRQHHLRVGITYTGDSEERSSGVSSTVEAVRRALESRGHEVVELEATPELPSILPASALDLVFNMARGVRGRHREAHVPALLELLDIEYTGSDSAAMAFAFDRPLSKRLVSEAGCAVPLSLMLTSPKERLPRELTYPAVVKPPSILPHLAVDPEMVPDEDSLRARVGEILAARRGEGVVVESYVKGREFVLGLLGERRPRVLPPMEAIFDSEIEFPFLSNTLDREGVGYRVPAEVSPGVLRSMSRVARTAFTVLGCRDVARVVVRVDAAGKVYFISCTPLPALTPGKADLFRIAEAAGLDFRSLVHEILAPAQRRLREARRARFIAATVER